MYQVMENNEVVRNTILADLYNIIGRSVDKGLYAFKGGYILSKKVNGVRKTMDIDMTILNKYTFELATSSIKGYLENLKVNGFIWGYEFKMPVIEGSKNMSGGVKIFVKPDANTSKRKLCGVDMSIHPLDRGVELSVEGFPQYSNELMLADKVSALYNTEKNVLRRIRDIFDIYLILSISNSSLNKQLILDKIKERNVNIQSQSTFEYLLVNEPKKITEELNKALIGNTLVDREFLSISKINVKVIIEKDLLFLSMLRR